MTLTMTNHKLNILKTVFGYGSFRPLQEACIDAILSKQDTMLIMPTGAGKSICYQIPALMFDGLMVVVSPLISQAHARHGQRLVCRQRRQRRWIQPSI